MANPPVHWHEGMFLRPQHFQTAQRHWADAVVRNSKWDHCYNWGLRSLELDTEALANFRCVVRTLQARLRDGGLVTVSAEDPLPPLGLRGVFERQSNVTVYLGVPRFHLSRPNVGSDDARCLVESADLPDENSGLNPQSIPVRRLNLRLLLSGDDLTGYDVLPLARLEKSIRAEGTPQVDETFCPPLLACDAWKPLHGDLLQAVYDRIGKKMELLADQVVARGLNFDSNAQGDALTFNQLRQLNEAYTVLGVLVFAQGVHPLWAYSELCRLVGQLAIFGPQRRPPDLPLYDHDDLARCFAEVKKHLDTLLDVFVEPEYRERPFVGAGLRMQVSLEPSWLEPQWQLFLGVKSTLERDACVGLVTGAANLDMKIGSSDRVDAIFRKGEAGLRFSHLPHPPRALPLPQGQVYFHVLREGRDPEWQHVQKSLTLAIRVNENLILGSIEGQRSLTIQHAGQTVPVQFSLYVLPQPGKA